MDEDDPLRIADIEKRTRNAFRIAFSFIMRLREENELKDRQIMEIENKIQELRKDLNNLTRIGEN